MVQNEPHTFEVDQRDIINLYSNVISNPEILQYMFDKNWVRVKYVPNGEELSIQTSIENEDDAKHAIKFLRRSHPFNNVFVTLGVDYTDSKDFHLKDAKEIREYLK